MSIVPDASFITAATVASQRRPACVDALAEAQRTRQGMLAPYLLQSEFASATLSLERRGQLLRQERLEAWATFRSLEIEYRWDDAWVDRAIEIADKAGQSRVYDSLYLACAEAYGFDLLTCDASFVRALGPNPPGVVRLVG